MKITSLVVAYNCCYKFFLFTKVCMSSPVATENTMETQFPMVSCSLERFHS